MNLLPKSHKEFSSAEYWEKFFKKRGDKAFEWYGEYPQLCGLIHKYIKYTDKILVAGCGNSSLSADMYDVGYHNIVNVDISDVVIQQMTKKHATDRPKMTFAKMDILKMSEFSDGEFSVVLDKGTLDAMATDESEATQEKVCQMFSEIGRVLRVGGRYVCISLAQGHILAAVLRYFTKECWMIRVCRVMEEREDDHKLQLPVFVFVLTKFKKMPNMQSILEVSQFEDKVERYKTIEEVMGVIGEIQQYALVRQKLNKGNVTGENISFDLYNAEMTEPRYTLHVVDCRKRLGNKFAIFIVPEGRELEWLFSTKDGREQLCQSAGFQRLVVVTLHRGHRYGNLDDVKEELSGKVMELAPADISSRKVPFLSVGDDIHCRTVRHQGASALSGDYVIEDVESDSSIYRRLVFMSSQSVVQTEAKLIQEFTRKKGKRKKGKQSVDPHYLSWSYSSVMLAGLAFLEDCQHLLNTETRLLLVGLGGGILPMFIYRHFPQVYTEVVEIDQAVATLASDWFGFVQDERMKLHVADGVDHVNKLAKEGAKKHVIMLDADSKDSSIGMSGPPQAFLEREFLEAISSILDARGVLILNLICRDQNMRRNTLEKIHAVFHRVYGCKLQDDVNEVVFALPNDRTTPVCTSADDASGAALISLDTALSSVQDVLQKAMTSSTLSKPTDVLDLSVKLSGLTVV